MVEEEGRHRGLQVLHKEAAGDVAEGGIDVAPAAGTLVVGLGADNPVADHNLEVVPGTELHKVVVAVGKDCDLEEDTVGVAVEGTGYGKAGHEEGVAEVGSRAAVGAADRIDLGMDIPVVVHNLEEVQVVEHHKVVGVGILEVDIGLAEVVRTPDKTCCGLLSDRNETDTEEVKRGDSQWMKLRT